MVNFIGIDLGTTFSAIARINETGVPEVIPNSEGEFITPSVILFDGNEIHVGTYAKQNAVAYPGQVVESIKRFMGDGQYAFEHNGRRYSPPELSSFILRKLKQDAEEQLNTAIHEVVVTVPAYFGDPQRKATLEAGEHAGLKILQLLNEPTAAAYSYGLHKIGKDQMVLVFDLGGGTFDVTVLEIHGNTLEVKSTSGDHQLGGKDWDDVIIQRMAQRFREEYRLDPIDDDAAYEELKAKAVSAKIALSQLPKVNLVAGYRGKVIKEELTRPQFAELATSLLFRCQLLVDEVLLEAALTRDRIDTVLLAGGSTRIPMVREMLKTYFGKEPSSELNPDECVAKGAAIKAALLQKEKWVLPASQEKRTWALPQALRDVNVTSHSFGMVVLKDGELHNSVIIPKNTAYPCERSRSDYVTSYDNQQTMDLYLIEGELEDPHACVILGHYEVCGIPKRPAGKTTLKVAYKYNANQIIEVEAWDLLTNQRLQKGRKEGEVDLNQLKYGMKSQVALLLDCSGSMSGLKMQDAQRAAASFVDKVPSSYEIGLITFPGNIQHQLDEDHEGVKGALSRLSAGGGTPMAQAIMVAHQEMLIDHQGGKVIVLLTDGQPDDVPRAEAEAETAKQKGIRIITVGVGSDVNKDLLTRVASSRDDYHYVNESIELEGTFVSIATELAGSAHLKKK